MIKIIIPVVGLLLLGCGEDSVVEKAPVVTKKTVVTKVSVIKKALIRHECAEISGNGDITCDFINYGEAEGAACVTVFLVGSNIYMGSGALRMWEGKLGKYDKKDGNNTYATASIEGAQKVCSGLIKPKDTRTMKKRIGFSAADSYANESPSEMCAPDYGLGYSWTDVCSYKTKVAR